MACDNYPDLEAVINDNDPADVKKRAQATRYSQRRFYHAVRHLLEHQFNFNGNLPKKLSDLKTWIPGDPKPDETRAYFLAVSGLLLADGAQVDSDNPGVDDLVVKDHDDDIDPARGTQKIVLVPSRFVRAVTAAVQEYHSYRPLFNRVFVELARIGTADGDRTIFARQLAEVTRRLVERGTRADDSQLGKRIDDALSLALGDRVDGRASAIVLDLPDMDLDAGTAADIVKDNVLAVAVIYYAAMVEEWKFFAVVDKVAEQFTNGLLPISRGRGGDMIYEYIRAAPQRMTEFERRGLYARVLGLAQGSVEEAMPNREFADLWIRFLSPASLFMRQPEEGETKKVAEQQLYKAARDLGVNLSLHGYGMAHFAAAELQKLIRDVHAMLSNPDVRAAYGVRDGNQLVDRVCQLYLQGAVNGVRQRTMAHAGARIIGWIAENAQALSSPTTDVGNLFAKTNARFRELISYVERWLAVTGTPDPTVEQYSEPVSAQAQPTIPTLGLESLPGGFKNVLERAGIGNGTAMPAMPALPAP